MAVGSIRMQRALSARAARAALIAVAALAVLTEDKPGRFYLGATLRILQALVGFGLIAHSFRLCKHSQQLRRDGL